MINNGTVGRTLSARLLHVWALTRAEARRAVQGREQISDPQRGRALTAQGLARLAAEVLGASPYPALVLEVPSQRIVAAAERAALLLDPSGTPVVGHLLEEYTSDRPVIGTDLLAGGRLNGFEASRALRRSRGPNVKVRIWIRTFGHQPPSRLVLLVLVADLPSREKLTVAVPEWGPSTTAVVGTADSELRIERISRDAEQLFDTPVDDLVGRPFANFVEESDVFALADAFATASTSLIGVTTTVHVNLRSEDGLTRRVACELLLLPLQPAPSCAFVLIPTPPLPPPEVVHAESLPAILARLGKGAEVAHHVRGVFSGITAKDVPGINMLTTRELEIVGRLLDGDRVPAIAVRLFLTQSTVRNYLAAVFAKVGVNSQQQLVNLFR